MVHKCLSFLVFYIDQTVVFPVKWVSLVILGGPLQLAVRCEPRLRVVTWMESFLIGSHTTSSYLYSLQNTSLNSQSVLKIFHNNSYRIIYSCIIWRDGLFYKLLLHNINGKMQNVIITLDVCFIMILYSDWLTAHHVLFCKQLHCSIKLFIHDNTSCFFL